MITQCRRPTVILIKCKFEFCFAVQSHLVSEHSASCMMIFIFMLERHKVRFQARLKVGCQHGDY